MELIFNQWFGLHVREYFDNWDNKTMVDSSWLENLEFPYLNIFAKNGNLHVLDIVSNYWLTMSWNQIM